MTGLSTSDVERCAEYTTWLHTYSHHRAPRPTASRRSTASQDSTAG